MSTTQIPATPQFDLSVAGQPHDQYDVGVYTLPFPGGQIPHFDPQQAGFDPGVKLPLLLTLLHGHDFYAFGGAPVLDTSAAEQVLGMERTEPTENVLEDALEARRKALNRAAQRAFRERKEKQRREMENKFRQLEQDNKKLLEELRVLQQQNFEIQLQNVFLLQRHEETLVRGDGTAAETPAKPLGLAKPVMALHFAFPKLEIEFVEGMVDLNHHTFHVDKRFTYENSDHVMVMTISALWDYLMQVQRELDQDGLQELDIEGVMDELRGQESCHGYGPAYPVGLVKSVLSRHLKKY